MQRVEKAVIAGISIGFVIWGALFIYRSSFIAIDGRRYFCLFDDAMISMRYAWNFSHGLGLVWNPGEWVEGYSNLLMTLLMAFATGVFSKSTAALFIQIAGVGFMLGIAYLSMRIADEILRDETQGHRSPARVLVFLCSLIYYPLAYWTLMGMETGLLTALQLASVLAAFRYVRTANPKLLFAAAAFLGLAFLTRNDSILFAALVWLYILWQSQTLPVKRTGLQDALAAIGLFLLFVVAQVGFRYLYYGELVPNTYTLKLTGMPLVIRIQNGFDFVIPFMKETAIMLVLAGAGVIFAYQNRKLLLLCLALSAICYQVYVGGDPWTYWRFLSPAMPLVTILFVLALKAGADALQTEGASSSRSVGSPGFLWWHAPGVFSSQLTAAILLVLATLVGMISADARFLPEIQLRVAPYLSDLNQLDVNVAIAVAAVTTGDATVGVVSAGAIPYYSGRKGVDFLGMSDKYIADLPPDLSGSVGWSGTTSAPGHNKYDLTYSVMRRLPTYVAVFAWGRQDISAWGASRYVRAKYKGIWINLLKDSPQVLWDKLKIPRP